jgi:hypothetical protein
MPRTLRASEIALLLIEKSPINAGHCGLKDPAAQGWRIGHRRTPHLWNTGKLRWLRLPHLSERGIKNERGIFCRVGEFGFFDRGDVLGGVGGRVDRRRLGDIGSNSAGCHQTARLECFANEGAQRMRL